MITNCDITRNSKGRFPSNMLLTMNDGDPLFMVPKAGNDERFGYCRDCSLVFPLAQINEHREHDHEAHPTVKPVSLMRHLVRLITPRGGTVLEIAALDDVNWAKYRKYLTDMAEAFGCEDEAKVLAKNPRLVELRGGW